MSKSLVIVVILLVIGFAWFAGLIPNDSKMVVEQPETLQVVPVVPNEPVTEIQIQQFCSGCHVVPPADLLPRESWPEEIAKAFRRFRDSGRKDLVPPDRADVTEYFSRRAPEELVLPVPPVQTPSPLAFQSEVINCPNDWETSGVSFLNTAKSQNGIGLRRMELLSCDMGSGWTNRLMWNEGQASIIPLCKLSKPCHIVECDFDRDGKTDYLVADLGQVTPSDDLKGSVVFLRSPDGNGSYEIISVREELGRVTDAELADLDGDGDDDIVVAEFGYEKTGRLLWFERKQSHDNRPEFELHVIDERHGSIHCPVTDLDGDGDLDVVVLVSQEYEMILACLNDGHGRFEKRTLYQANNPSFGSSGMELVDLDQDGDLDVLFTNGDTLDTMQLKPFHGISWLENRGHCQFEYHRLTLFPGAMRAVSGDFDNDGDVDIVAVAYCPPELRHQKRPMEFDSMIWLEQIAPGQFDRHRLESLPIGHLALTAGDFDGDNDLDFAVADFVPNDPRNPHWLTIYWNQIPAKTDQKTTFKR